MAFRARGAGARIKADVKAAAATNLEPLSLYRHQFFLEHTQYTLIHNGVKLISKLVY